ncbi:MAG: chorismate synthase [Hyphomicrobiales bacterium]|nr:chorismate synthase [Hyphomicrobiales bacterium]MCY4038912.1 chorismate synthase [Hyphomicrobiales bacterium]
MSHNSFGHLFRVTSWGESHGPAIGGVVDGMPPRISFRLGQVQKYLDQRRPGASKFTSQRREADKVKILSGVLPRADSGDDVELTTTGTPVSMLIENVDARPKDYESLGGFYRPGHADHTYQAKYGIRDASGGGRASARETAVRVAAGALARLVIPSVKIRGALVALGENEINHKNWNWEEAENNDFWCPDAKSVPLWEKYLQDLRKEGSSCGAVVEVHAHGVPAGWGAPVYGKLDADLAAAMMGINAVKGVEIGAGFSAAKRRGEGNADEMRMEGDQIRFGSNHSGGINGGISTGQDVVVRFAVKPTSSIPTPLKSVDDKGREGEVSTKGRHDPCVGIRAVPVGEAMMALVLADHYLRHRAQTGAA